MNKEIIIGFFIVLIIASSVKIFFNYNININIIHWSIDSILINIYILTGSFLMILGLVFLSKYLNKK
ncbi:membrane protein NosY [Arcobacter nitrofigilis DSM 7299]|uniref:Membrane protein NosY n=1 Tax=Arcobacter nitrofigilis (strain ATCC 33309 / DSM 7299 / CCUG 15893 / LMG 7604 / NCTC 12251 / CI) TaxID=572480 RepID=D5V608_ARCNC|nr:hypothetical protein [Arcobacter nitrofigilis]ADG93175.1 membrane protein NosY [Arcobacter nitrofigilis DSM 7299]